MITYEAKTYLGDGLFVQRDSLGRVILSTEDGMSVTNQVYLEPEVLAAFDAWRQVMSKTDERVAQFMAAGDGRYCRHHDDDPAHGAICYDAEVNA